MSTGTEKGKAEEREIDLFAMSPVLPVDLSKSATMASNAIIELNVGGKRMSISRKILTMVEGTVLAQLFADCQDGEHFLDYDPQVRRVIVVVRVQGIRWSLSLSSRLFSSLLSCLETCSVNCVTGG